MKIWLFMFLGLFCFLSGTAAKEVRFETHTFMPSLGLELNWDKENASPSLDMKDTLEIEDTQTLLSRLYFNDDFRVSYANFDYAGKKPLLLPGEGDLSLASTLGLRYWGFGWFLPLVEKTNFRMDFLADLKAYRVDGQLGAFFRDAELISTAKTALSGIAPSFGIAVRGDVTENLFLYAEAAGLPLGSYGSFFETDIGFKYKVKDHTFMQMGYKTHNVKTNHQFLETSLATKINGPYFGLNFSI